MALWLKALLLPVLLVLLTVFNPPQFDTQVLGLIPQADLDERDLELLDRPINANATNLVVLLRSSDPSELIQSLESTYQLFLESQLFVTVEGRADTSGMLESYRQLEPYALNFAPSVQFDERAGDRWTERRWYDPSVSANQLSADPLQVNFGLIQFLSNQSRGFSMVQGWPLKQQEETWGGVLLLSASSEANSYRWQQRFETLLAEVVEQSHNKSVDVFVSGAPRYAYAAVQQAKSESSIIGGASFVLIAALLFYVFRRLVLLVTVILPLLIGSAFAIVVTSWWFSSIHVLTLVFGASLIGVSVDFAFHWLFAKHSTHLKEVNRLLWVSAISTAVAFYLQSFSNYEIVAQMGVFAAVGVIGALTAVVLMFPVLTPALPNVSRIVPQMIEAIPVISANPRVVFAVVGIAFAGLLYHVSPDDDVRKLQAVDAQLQSEQEIISEWLNIDFSPTYLIVRATDQEALVKSLYDVSSRLDRLQLAGDITAYDHPATRVLPYHIQRERVTKANAWLDEGGRWQRLEVEDNFQRAPEAEQERLNRLDVLTLDTLLALPMFSHLSSMVVEDEIDASAVVSISGANRNVSVALSGHEGETYIDRVELISQSLSDGRVQAQLWLAVALICLFVGFAATAGIATSFRRLSVVLSGVIGGLGLVTLSGVGLQVFVVLSLLLVVGLSIDYSVFADSYADARQSIICSGLTTVLAFGLLAFSAVPVLQSIGFTVAGGVSAAMLMAFLLRRTQ